LEVLSVFLSPILGDFGGGGGSKRGKLVPYGHPDCVLALALIALQCCLIPTALTLCTDNIIICNRTTKL